MAAMGEPAEARSPSTSSAYSCINVMPTHDRRDDTVLSSTPPTSMTDVTSVGSGNEQSKTGAAASGRIRRVRASVPTYNENALSGSRRSSTKVLRDASGKTLVAGKNTSHDRLMASGLQALDMEWEVGTMPGEQLQQAMKENTIPARSAGTKTFNKAAAALGNTASVLGKRSRAVFESSKGKINRAGKRSSKRLKALDAPKEDPAPKKTRLAGEKAKLDEAAKRPAPQPMKTRASEKKLLAQGLYVGQDPSFDPRFTVEKNKKRHSTLVEQMTKLPTILPPPMFAGKRLLEQTRGFRLPYNIFHPLPAGQPKPDEWRKTRKNVFVGDAGDLWKKSEKMEDSVCMCSPELGCGEDCMNRYMFYECDENNCAVGAYKCSNRAFADLKARTKAGGKYRIGVEVIKTRDRGYGVRSNRCFEPGQIIVEYTGEIITQEESDERMKKRYKNNECFYLMEFDQNMIIDATRGSIARFVNHSCEPNCKMVKWTVAGKPRMALFAGEHGIMTGEELCYDYNFDPFSSKNIQECRCGATSCRGVLGPRTAREKELKDALAPLTQPVGAKRKLANMAGGVAKATGNVKRRKIAPVSRAVKGATSRAIKGAASRAVNSAASKAVKGAASKIVNGTASKAVVKTVSKSAAKANSKAVHKAVKRAVRGSGPHARKAVVAVKRSATAVSKGAIVVRNSASAVGKTAAVAKKAAAAQAVGGTIVVTATPSQQARLVKKASEISLGAALGMKRQTTLSFAKRSVRPVAT